LQAAHHSTWLLMQAAVRDRFAGESRWWHSRLFSSAQSRAPSCIPDYATSRALTRPCCWIRGEVAAAAGGALWSPDARLSSLWCPEAQGRPKC